MRAYLRERIVQETRAAGDRAFGGTTFCDRARKLYGEFGDNRPGYIVNRDGSDALPKCWHNGGCSTYGSTFVILD